MDRAAWKGARSGAGLEIVASALFTLVVAWPFLRLDRYVTGFDTVAYSGPNLDLTLRSMRAGNLLAGWNDAIFGGVPHLGNPQAGAVYAPKWVFAWLQLGTHRSWDLLVALHLFLLAAGVLVLVRRGLRLAPPAGFAAVLVVVGSGHVMIRTLFLEQIMVIAWAPWLLFAIDRVLVGRWRPVAGLAAVTALMLTAGHPQPVFLVAWMAGLWALVRAADRRAWRRLGAVAVGAGLGVAMAAVQLLPSLDLSERSATSGGRDLARVSAAGWSVVARVLPGTIFGDVFARDHPVTATTHEAMTFIGVAGVLLAATGLVVAVVRWRAPDLAALRWTVLGSGLAATVGLVLGLGPRFLPYRAAFRLVPLFDLARVPARWTLLTVLGSGVLAAVGVDALAKGRLTRPVATSIGVAAAAGAVVIALGPFTLPPDRAPLTWLLFGGGVVAALVAGASPSRTAGREELVAAGGRAGRRAARRRRAAGRAAVAAVAILAIELTALQVHSVGRRSETDEPFTDWRTPFAGELGGGGRVLALTRDQLGDYPYLGASLRPNANVYQELRSIDGYDGGVQVTTRWAEAMAPLAAGPVFDAELTLRAQIRLPIDGAQLARFGVRDVLLDTALASPEQAVPGWQGPVAQEGSLQVWRNPVFAGEARIVPGATATAGSAVALRRSDLGQRIDVDSLPAPAAGSTAAGSTATVVTDEQWDPGWTAQVDGRALPVRAVDGFFLGVDVPAGARQVTFRYEPVHARAGLAISGVAVVIGLLLAVGDGWPLRRRRGLGSDAPHR